MSSIQHNSIEADAIIATLRRKCDEAIAARASETCAMAQKLAAVTAERDKYEAALKVLRKYVVKDVYDKLFIDGTLAERSPEDDIEQARRQL